MNSPLPWLASVAVHNLAMRTARQNTSQRKSTACAYSRLSTLVTQSAHVAPINSSYTKYTRMQTYIVALGQAYWQLPQHNSCCHGARRVAGVADEASVAWDFTPHTPAYMAWGPPPAQEPARRRPLITAVAGQALCISLPQPCRRADGPGG
eukprot:gene8473-biopygen6128